MRNLTRLLRGGEPSASKRALKLLLRLALGAVFLYAAWDKLLNPDQLAEIILDYQLVPHPLVNPAAIWLTMLQVFIGLAAIGGLWVRPAALTMTGLSAIFLGALIITLARGLDFECGCFSTTPTGDTRTWASLWEEGLLLVACATLWWLHWPEGRSGRSAAAD